MGAKFWQTAYIKQRPWKNIMESSRGLIITRLFIDNGSVCDCPVLINLSSVNVHSFISCVKQNSTFQVIWFIMTVCFNPVWWVSMISTLASAPPCITITQPYSISYYLLLHSVNSELSNFISSWFLVFDT